jgi:hypothetical protein
MINSTNINDLRQDVRDNCKILLDMCKDAGFKAGLSCTYRDQEYQTYLHNTQGAPKTVSFHGARLAFDVYENLNGKTSYREEFFDFIAPLAKKMGFTWMQDITHADKPHFQWDDHRNFSGIMVINHNLPPFMPLYEEVDNMNIENLTDEQAIQLWNKLLNPLKDNDSSEWSSQGRQWAIDSGIIKGDGSANPNYQWEAPLTREQMSLMLYRFAQYIGKA